MTLRSNLHPLGSGEKCPYEKEQVLLEKTSGSGTISLLVKGVYTIICVGGGGGGSGSSYQGANYGIGSGGSGAGFLGEMSINKGTYTWSVGGAGSKVATNFGNAGTAGSGGTTSISDVIKATGGGGGYSDVTRGVGGGGGTLTTIAEVISYTTKSNGVAGAGVGNAYGWASDSRNGGGSVLKGYGGGGGAASLGPTGYNGGCGYLKIIFKHK